MPLLSVPDSGLTGERPLMAESSPSIPYLSDHLNVRFREKQTFSLGLTKTGRRGTALRLKAAIELIEF